MAKVRIDSLPEGFTIQDGKVVQTMQKGGSTGDQAGYSLMTAMRMPQANDSDQALNVRHSLAAVPREEANLEAEGGETVLTDLNNDGHFGLYDIKGPRHSKGGVPLNLPEQSFIYSDTKDLKLGSKDLSEFGIKSRKKITPAKVSKKYDLNTYYGAIRDEFADDISVKSAELMMDKNKKSLSKLAFVQEAKKDFEEGVPVAAHPYLMSQGIDPIEFTQKVEKISQEKAQEKAIAGLPPQQQQQLMMLQQMLQQADAQDQPMAEYGMELPQAQYGNLGVGLWDFSPGSNPLQQSAQARLSLGNPTLSAIYQQPSSQYGFDWMNPATGRSANQIYGIKGDALFGQQYNYGTSDYLDPNYNVFNDPNITNTNFSSNGSGSGTGAKGAGTSGGNTGGNKGKKRNEAVNDATVKNYTDLGINMSFGNVGERMYLDVQPLENKYGRFGDATQNESGWAESWAGIYPEVDKLISSLDTYKADNANDYKNPEVLAFQNWAHDEYIPAEVGRINQARIDAGYEPLTEEQTKKLTTDLRRDFGFNTDQKGRDFDGKFGTFTSSRRPFNYSIEPTPDVPKEGCPCEDGTYSQDCCPPPPPIDEGGCPCPDGTKSISCCPPPKRPNAEWWLQDLVQLNAVANRDRDTFFPFQPDVNNIDMGYVLEEPTRAIAATNERLGVDAMATGAFAGPQSQAARMANAQGQAASEIANEVARVNTRNVGTINQGLAMQAQLNMQLDRERRDRVVKEYDDTQGVLQKYMDEKNYDREQYARLLSNAITNRANTYNLNSIQDYYQVSGSSGGMIGQFSSKAFEPVQPSDPMQTAKEYGQMARYLKAYGVDPTPELIQQIMAGNQPTPQESNIQRAYRSMPQGYGYAYNPGMYNPGQQAKKGKEVKDVVLPFYLGTIGG